MNECSYIDYTNDGVYCGAYDDVRELEREWDGYRGCFAIVGGEPYWHNGKTWESCMGGGVDVTALERKVDALTRELGVLRNLMAGESGGTSGVVYMWSYSNSPVLLSPEMWSEQRLTPTASNRNVWTSYSIDGGKSWSEPVLSDSWQIPEEMETLQVFYTVGTGRTAPHWPVENMGDYSRDDFVPAGWRREVYDIEDLAENEKVWRTQRQLTAGGWSRLTTPEAIMYKPQSQSGLSKLKEIEVAVKDLQSEARQMKQTTDGLVTNWTELKEAGFEIIDGSVQLASDKVWITTGNTSMKLFQSDGTLQCKFVNTTVCEIPQERMIQ